MLLNFNDYTTQKCVTAILQNILCISKKSYMKKFNTHSKNSFSVSCEYVVIWPINRPKCTGMVFSLNCCPVFQLLQDAIQHTEQQLVCDVLCLGFLLHVGPPIYI